MKNKIDHLPLNKQDELAKVVRFITGYVKAEMIILFGSYARGNWVEERTEDGQHYQYRSDYDILVITATIKSEEVQRRIEREMERAINTTIGVDTPTSIIVHDITFFNRRLRKGCYFFTDIKKEGIALYDTANYALDEAKELLPSERQKLAQEDFNYYFEEAIGFKKGVDFYKQEGRLNTAAFLLHQTTERLYTALLLVFTRYKPNTHDLYQLRKLVNSIDPAFVEVLTISNQEEGRLFELLRKAYVDARYKRSYTITEEELSALTREVNKLFDLTMACCQQKIARFTD